MLSVRKKKAQKKKKKGQMSWERKGADWGKKVTAKGQDVHSMRQRCIQNGKKGGTVLTLRKEQELIVNKQKKGPINRRVRGRSCGRKKKGRMVGASRRQQSW